MKRYLFKQRPSPLAPVTTPGYIQIVEDAEAIIFRNAGTATINLWGGAYTLCPKETLSFNITDDKSILEITDISITFDTSTGSEQMLQIVVLKSSPC